MNKINTILFIKFNKIILLIFLLLMVFKFTSSQTCYNIYVDSIKSRVSSQLIIKYNRELSGDTSTIIGGQSYRIISRYNLNEGNQKAAQCIYEKFQSFGLSPQYLNYSPTGRNVIAKKTGIKYPNQYLIVCAHYDDYRLGANPLDTVPGADDNATGVCCVLEAARLISPYNTDYSIVFALWDEEEVGMWGSRSYADSAYSHNDSIIGVINLDMIGYDGNNDNQYCISSMSNSLTLAEKVFCSGLIYTPIVNPMINLGIYPSDQQPFSQKNYKAIAMNEEINDFSPFVHTKNDLFSTLNKPYLTNLVKAAVCAAANIVFDYNIIFIHTPISSTSSTSDITVKAIIKSNWGIGKNTNVPRLYYKIGNLNYDYILPSSIVLDTFKFIIPGQPKGSTITYYLAAQDSLSTISGTYPYGGSGLNPPGTNIPPSQFTYHIDNSIGQSSTTLPKTIGPKQNVFDTISINQTGLASDVNIYLTLHHSNDSDLYIYITGPDVGLVSPLSLKNGGSGDNYIGTTFDDEAATPITQGTPPFMGSFRPQNELSIFDNKEIFGKWVLRIYNNSNTISGILNYWKVAINYFDPIAVTKNTIPVGYSLSQNYPNPFNPATKIEFSILKESEVRIVVYDVLGRQVRTLINDKLKSGNYTTSLNGNGLSSGLYFYSMYVSGLLFDTKKMILIK